LDKQDFEVLVAVGSGDGELFKRASEFGIRINRLKQLKRTPWPWQIVLVCREIYDLLEREKNKLHEKLSFLEREKSRHQLPLRRRKPLL